MLGGFSAKQPTRQSTKVPQCDCRTFEQTNFSLAPTSRIKTQWGKNRTATQAIIPTSLHYRHLPKVKRAQKVSSEMPEAILGCCQLAWTADVPVTQPLSQLCLPDRLPLWTGNKIHSALTRQFRELNKQKMLFSSSLLSQLCLVPQRVKWMQV